MAAPGIPRCLQYCFAVLCIAILPFLVPIQEKRSHKRETKRKKREKNRKKSFLGGRPAALALLSAWASQVIMCYEKLI
jgi:hypothetical protein